MKTSLLIASVFAIFVGGCATTGLNNAFHKDGFPKQQYYVGGGLKILYSTQESGGTVIIADSVSRKILATESMTPNDEFDFSPVPQATSFVKALEMLGIDSPAMNLSLYFIPLEKTAEDDAK